MMNITSAKYFASPINGENTAIIFVIDGKTYSVTNPGVGNRHYDEIMKQVAAGDLTIADAD
tara:strand:- start:3 stop:185 length:183 start_codon:yes stop_codon:yes gene_type:complete